MHGVPRGLDSAPDEPRLAGDAERVQDKEGVVPQPVQRRRRAAARGERQGEVRVPDHLGDGPRHQHAAVRRACAELWEEVCDAPDDRIAAEDLHESREEGGADDAWVGMLMLELGLLCG